MFIAMNHFQVNPDRSDDFETMWKTRETHMRGVRGFRGLAVLKGDQPGDYASHTMWDTRADFEAWAKSDNFRSAHDGSMDMTIFAGHPQVKFWQAFLVEEPS